MGTPVFGFDVGTSTTLVADGRGFRPTIVPVGRDFDWIPSVVGLDPSGRWLAGEAALPEEIEAVSVALKSAPLVDSLIHLRTLHVGPDDLLVAAKVGIRHDVTAQEIVQGIDEAEKMLRASVPNATYVFIEPDFHRVQH